MQRFLYRIFWKIIIIFLCISPFTQALFNRRFLNSQVGLGFVVTVPFLTSGFTADHTVVYSISITKLTDVFFVL
jgi:hypothetical protein